MHPWLKEASPLYYPIAGNGNKIGPPTKINEEIYSTVRDMEFNYHNFTENKIKESILKKKDYSFVIAYDLMYDEASKKQLMTKRKASESGPNEPNVIMNGVINGANGVNGVNGAIFTKVKHEVEKFYEDPEYFNEVVNSYKTVEASGYQAWQYGLRFSMHPQGIMEGIIKTLNDLDTTFVVKSPNYRIKCFHKIHKKITHSSQIDIEYEKDFGDGEVGDHTTNTKGDKFTTNELIFIIQIYSIPGRLDHVVDIQRTKGHTIVFLEFCHKFSTYLHKKLT